MGDFFERCKECKACCKTSDRFVHIYVCGHEKGLISLLSSLGLDTRDIIVPFSSTCRFMGPDGCTLGAMKPFQCRAYPVLFLSDGSLGVDPACTFSGEYLSRLQDPDSDARQHYEAVKKEIAELGDGEKLKLADWSRYVCDVVRVD